MASLLRDLRYAMRLLRKSPGFTLAAVLMLAVGIGVNVAAFGFFNLMVLRPLPVRDPATLLRFQRLTPQRYASALPYPEIAFFREHATTLSAIMAWSPAKLTLDSEEEPVKAQFVTTNLFGELGAVPALGRLLDPAIDDAPGAEPVVVLSQGFWQRHFGADPAIAGKTIRLNGQLVTVVGVAAGEFSGLTLDAADLWAPLTQHASFVAGSTLLTDWSVERSSAVMWGRLRHGLTPSAAEGELRVLAAELRRQCPDDIWENEGLPSQAGAYATSAMNTGSYGTGTRGPSKLVPLAGMVGALALLILAVSCANLGSLLLARGVAREREISIRVAIGAGRGQLVRQLFTESAFLGLLGAGAGLGLGYVVLRVMMAMTGAPAWLDPSPDWRVTMFAVAIGFTAAILFGLTPALQAARQRHRATLMRQILIGAQVAASCVLVILAGLLVRALNHATSADPGFQYKQVVSIDPALGAHGYSPAGAAAYLETLTSRLREVPGVQSVAMATTIPLGSRTTVVGLNVDGRGVGMHINHIDAPFFEAMSIPILRGRNLRRGDTHSIIVSQSLALVVWPGDDPLGKPLDLGNRVYTVVGIAGNARVTALQDPDAAEGYFLGGPDDLTSTAVLVKTSGPPESVATALTSIARGIDPRILPDVRLMKTSFQRKLEDTQYSALSISVLAVVALLLACLGIVGLVAYSVSQRIKEIGIRVALGATPARVLASVLGQFSRPVVAGLVVGLGGAAALSQVMRRMLYGISNHDPLTYVAAVGLFSITVVAASLVPARRALRVDPMRALRVE